MSRLLAEVAALLVDPGEPPAFLQFVDQRVVDFDQVFDILGGVLELFFMKRSLSPIREGLPFGDLLPKDLMDQPAVPALGPIPKQGGRDLSVEDGRREATRFLEKDLHVLETRVKDLHRIGTAKEVPHRGGVADRLVVDDGDLAVGDDLDDLKAGIIGFLPDKFGVESDRVGAGVTFAVILE